MDNESDFFTRGLTAVGTADAEINIPSVENPELKNVLPLTPGVGQNIAMLASSNARSFFLVLFSTFPVHSPSFSPNPLPTFQLP